MAPSNIILYGLDASPPVRCVLLTAKVLGIQLDYKILDILKGEQKTEEYLKLNPQHTIPTMDDNGFILWDSHAISTYLISQYGPKECSLYPTDIKKRALIDQKLHFDSGILFPRTRGFLEPIIFWGKTSGDPEALKKIYEAYDFLEAFLKTDPYLVGDSLTLADLSCVSSVSSLEQIASIDRSKYPKISAWLDRLKDLPYYKECNGLGAEALGQLYRTKTGQA